MPSTSCLTHVTLLFLLFLNSILLFSFSILTISSATPAPILPSPQPPHPRILAVRLSTPHIYASLRSNLSLTCHVTSYTVQRFSDRPQIALTFFVQSAPGGQQVHHIYADSVECVRSGSECVARFAVEIRCLQRRLNLAEDVKFACQIIDADICSREWRALNGDLCYDTAWLTVLKGQYFEYLFDS